MEALYAYQAHGVLQDPSWDSPELPKPLAASVGPENPFDAKAGPPKVLAPVALGPSGIVWPEVGSTAEVAKALLAAAAAGIDDAAATAVAGEKKWRDNYITHFNDHVEMCLASPDAALRAARQGLAFFYENFKFSRDGKVSSIEEAMAAPLRPCPYRVAVVNGEQAPSTRPELLVPWSISVKEGPKLAGEELEAQMAAAVSRGVMEPTALAALRRLHQNPKDLVTLLSNSVFVALGAGSAMGPVETLLSLGATVVAIDLAIPAMWKRLIATARRSPGTLLVPFFHRSPEQDFAGDDEGLAEAAGCNMIEETPEVLDWLLSLELTEKRLVVGGYAYADGSDFPRATLAMDAIAQGLVAGRPEGEVSLAYLCSPTDAFGIPAEARRESEQRHTVEGLGAGKAWWQLPLRIGGRFLKPNRVKDGQAHCGMHLVDCFVSQQGPNYIVAKRLQHWRAILARSQGRPVSSNVAPASHTFSVRKAALLAAAYDGARHFGVEIFHPSTSCSLMTGLLLHDLLWPDEADGEHPLALFCHGAVHNGFWRMPYLLRSIVEPAAAIQLAMNYKVPHVLGAGVATLALRSRL